MADCFCRRCLDTDTDVISLLGIEIPVSALFFTVCGVCGNKRCPKATDHRYECTGSNEPGQIGSIYMGSPVNVDWTDEKKASLEEAIKKVDEYEQRSTEDEQRDQIASTTAHEPDTTKSNGNDGEKAKWQQGSWRG
ncbi:hypothetical protein [Photobacterium halotolerans]|uniref:hypothetical protein n=1 Tax=Photobacterium halotolerans TaxID=265726 RepID=UPI0005670634|nr:hypothetical protein [Photobacterium halotolerans]